MFLPRMLLAARWPLWRSLACMQGCKPLNLLDSPAESAGRKSAQKVAKSVGPLPRTVGPMLGSGCPPRQGDRHHDTYDLSLSTLDCLAISGLWPVLQEIRICE